MSTVIVNPPIEADITMTKGADWHRTVTMYEDDRVTPKNTTGYAVEMVIRSGENGETYDTLSTVNGKIVNTPSSGQFNFNLTAAQIDAYDFVTAEYKVIVTDGSGGKTALMTGKVKINP